MKSPKPAGHKHRHPKRERITPGHHARRLLSVRSALIIELAVLAGLGGAGLLYLAHRSPVQITLSAIGIFAASLKLLDSMIE
jgi:hypothetical protein